MTNPVLTTGIRMALQRSGAVRRLPTPHDIADEAASARACIESCLEGIADLGSSSDPRTIVALQLFRASMDHARALLFLLSANPQDMAVVALGMHRPQCELFMRGVFVRYIAEEAQLDDFIQEDRGPRRLNAKKKWEPIPFKDLASEVEAVMAKLGQDQGEQKLARVFSNNWDPLCGLVHGGRAVRAFYRDGEGRVGSHVSAEILFQTTTNVVATSNYCFIAALLATRIEDSLIEAAVRRASVMMETYLELRATRLAQLSLRS